MFSMNKTLSLLFLGLLVISMLGAVSATTVVMGTVYNQDFSAKIGDASITVACSHGNDINYQYATSASSGDQIGDYLVYFPEIGEGACDGGDSVTVTAEKGDSVGSETESVVDDAILDLDVAVINVSVPEFGLIIGVLTVLSAVGVFFFVRKE